MTSYFLDTDHDRVHLSQSAQNLRRHVTVTNWQEVPITLVFEVICPKWKCSPPKKFVICFAFTNRGSHGKFDGIHVASSDKWVRFAKILDTSGNVLIHQLLK